MRLKLILCGFFLITTATARADLNLTTSASDGDSEAPVLLDPFNNKELKPETVVNEKQRENTTNRVQTRARTNSPSTYFPSDSSSFTFPMHTNSSYSGSSSEITSALPSWSATPTAQPLTPQNTQPVGKSPAKRSCKKLTNGFNRSQGLMGGDNYGYIGCGSSHITVGRSTHTAEQFIVSTRFRSFLNAHLMSCTNEALRSAGYSQKAAAVHIRSSNTYRRGLSSNGKYTTHNSGRAIDIHGIRVVLSNGREMSYPGGKKDFPFYTAQRRHPFYEKFASCWRQKIRNSCPGASWTRTPSCGVLDANVGSSSSRRAHYNHLHVVLPFCGNRPSKMNLF